MIKYHDTFKYANLFQKDVALEVYGIVLWRRGMVGGRRRALGGRRGRRMGGMVVT